MANHSGQITSPPTPAATFWATFHHLECARGWGTMADAKKADGATVGWVQLRFPVKLSVVGALILAILTSWYGCVASTKETLLFFLLGLTALGTVTAAFYTARILVATLFTARSSSRFR